ncbi:DUF423 domain-containing protein [Mesorhizobium sp. 1B3]|uniref:DUF423 domain-containing protein n=1 Tax=Mesorhizobium sp. 1B3 TaxID=3243599 RepID=UPI003D95576E
MIADRILVLTGGVAGAAGVALSAVAAHAGGGNVGTAASFLLMHAPVFVASGLLRVNVLLRIGSLVLLVGLLLFCGDLLMRAYAGTRLFPMAAPTGGAAMILGWLMIAGSAFGLGRASPDRP